MERPKKSFKNLIDTSTVDFGKTSKEYASRPGFPTSFYDRMEKICPFEGKQVLDIATGTGQIALEVASRGATIIGIDISTNQIENAKERAKNLGLEKSCQFNVSSAEDSKQPDSFFDIAFAGQCWHWFNAARAMAEIKRILKPGGYLVVCAFCYLPKRSAVAKRTEDLILKYNPQWQLSGWDGLFPQQVDQLVVDGGFDLTEQFCYDHMQNFSHSEWISRISTCNGVGSGNLSQDQLNSFFIDLKDMLLKEFPEEPMGIWHRIFAVVVRKL